MIDLAHHKQAAVQVAVRVLRVGGCACAGGVGLLAWLVVLRLKPSLLHALGFTICCRDGLAC
jgi:hypothetical protein